MVRTFLLLSALLFFFFAKAQNIVPNGDLEDVNICPEFHAPCSPSAWFIVKKSTPGGYYHLYPSPAASGKQYFDLNVANTGNSRQYWETMLLCPLVPGEKYDVSIKVAADEIGPNVNDIGLYFTHSFIFSKSDTLLQPPSYLSFLDAKASRLKNNWFLLKKQFIASTDAGYLVVGNFSSEDNLSIVRKRNARNDMLNLMVDDIAIIPQHAVRCHEYQKNKDSLYAITQRHSNDTLSEKSNTAELIKVADTGKTVTLEKNERVDTLYLSNVLFEFDRYLLINPDTLETFRAALSNAGIKNIRVVGYTDDAGTEAYNAILSEKRALEIAKQIVNRFNKPAAIVQGEGKGISTRYSDKSLNRRVEIYIYYQEPANP